MRRFYTPSAQTMLFVYLGAFSVFSLLILAGMLASAMPISVIAVWVVAMAGVLGAFLRAAMGGLFVGSGRVEIRNFIRSHHLSAREVDKVWWRPTGSVTHRAIVRTTSGRDIQVDTLFCSHAEIRPDASRKFQATIDEINSLVTVEATLSGHRGSDHPSAASPSLG